MIDVADLEVTLGGVSVLAGVSVSIPAGRLYGLVGPNGAGKTTFLRAINGLVAPAAGTVRIDGHDVTTLSARALGQLVATVPQDTAIGFDFSVRDVVAMGRTPHRRRLSRTTATDRDAVQTALERTATARFADRPVSALSGGERQRVLIARALAQDTPALLLDEPTASLDIGHQARLFELVRDLIDEGRAAIAAVHDLDLAARYCDSIVLLSEGRLLACGEPSAVLTPGRIRRAFGTAVAVEPDGVTGTPSVTVLPEK